MEAMRCYAVPPRRRSAVHRRPASRAVDSRASTPARPMVLDASALYTPARTGAAEAGLQERNIDRHSNVAAFCLLLCQLTLVSLSATNAPAVFPLSLTMRPCCPNVTFLAGNLLLWLKSSRQLVSTYPLRIPSPTPSYSCICPSLPLEQV